MYYAIVVTMYEYGWNTYFNAEVEHRSICRSRQWSESIVRHTHTRIANVFVDIQEWCCWDHMKTLRIYHAWEFNCLIDFLSHDRDCFNRFLLIWRRCWLFWPQDLYTPEWWMAQMRRNWQQSYWLTWIRSTAANGSRWILCQQKYMATKF